MATQNIIDVQIPALKDLCNSGSLSIDSIDVFCEKGVFDTDASRRILRAGQEAGWKVNFHGDELHPMNSGEVRALGKKRFIMYIPCNKELSPYVIIIIPAVHRPTAELVIKFLIPAYHIAGNFGEVF